MARKFDSTTVDPTASDVDSTIETFLGTLTISSVEEVGLTPISNTKSLYWIQYQNA